MMKSKIAAAFAAVLTLGAASAFAANPFVDVPTDSGPISPSSNWLMPVLSRASMARISRGNAILPVMKLLK